MRLKRDRGIFNKIEKPLPFQASFSLMNVSWKVKKEILFNFLANAVVVYTFFHENA